jgi:hypothetical protein
LQDLKSTDEGSFAGPKSTVEEPALQGRVSEKRRNRASAPALRRVFSDGKYPRRRDPPNQDSKQKPFYSFHPTLFQFPPASTRFDAGKRNSLPPIDESDSPSRLRTHDSRLVTSSPATSPRRVHNHPPFHTQSQSSLFPSDPESSPLPQAAAPNPPAPPSHSDPPIVPRPSSS